MTKKEFIEKLKAMLESHLSDRDRTESSWWLAVETTAASEYDRTYRLHEKEPT